MDALLDNLKVAFLDVGQGDTIVVSNPTTHEAVVVDCINANAVLDYLTPTFRSSGKRFFEYERIHVLLVLQENQARKKRILKTCIRRICFCHLLKQAKRVMYAAIPVFPTILARDAPNCGIWVHTPISVERPAEPVGERSHILGLSPTKSVSA